MIFPFQEFYEPMKKTCLLNKDQLDSIFLNLDELIHVNTYFLGKLRAAINSANHNNDEVCTVLPVKSDSDVMSVYIVIRGL